MNAQPNTNSSSLFNCIFRAANIPSGVVQKSIDASLCSGIYHSCQQVGFASVITDGATFGYLASVFVLPALHVMGSSNN